MYIADARQIREADRIQIEDKQMPGILLMEQAGSRAAQWLAGQYPQQAFLVLAGPGNNGGDGLVIARCLHLMGREVQVLLSHDPGRYTGDALINYRIICELPVPLIPYGEEDLGDIIDSFRLPLVLVDALLGTGVEDELRGSIAALLIELRAWDLPVVAVDLPSGLSAGTGAVINEPLAAAHTLTFHLPKLCHYLTPAATYCGAVQVLDIGIWPEVTAQLGIRRRLITPALAQFWQRPRQPDAHKGHFGHLLLIGGSRDLCGAVTLAARAALRSGTGLLTVLTPAACRTTVLAHAPEAMCMAAGEGETPWFDASHVGRFEAALRGKTAVAIGPGLGTHTDTVDFFAEILPRISCPLLLDADALNILAAEPGLWPLLPPQTVLTPHPGEMLRLTGRADVNERRLEVAEELAHARQVVVLLKGAGTVVALPDGDTYINSSGNPGMATGGSGDVLTGVIGALLAQGEAAGVAAARGAYLHGLAGDLAAARLSETALIAGDLVDALPQVFVSLLRAGTSG
ncbi:MAG: NAD(P)H-hydrate dehydratase [Bacteroidia bacterium]